MARDIRVSIDLNEEKVRECAEEAITGEVRRILDEEFTETLKNMIRPAVESRLRKFFDFRGELNRNQTIDDLIRKQIAEIAAAKGFDKRLAELVDQYCQQYIDKINRNIEKFDELTERNIDRMIQNHVENALKESMKKMFG